MTYSISLKAPSHFQGSTDLFGHEEQGMYLLWWLFSNDLFRPIKSSRESTTSTHNLFSIQISTEGTYHSMPSPLLCFFNLFMSTMMLYVCASLLHYVCSFTVWFYLMRDSCNRFWAKRISCTWTFFWWRHLKITQKSL